MPVTPRFAARTYGIRRIRFGDTGLSIRSSSGAIAMVIATVMVQQDHDECETHDTSHFFYEPVFSLFGGFHQSPKQKERGTGEKRYIRHWGSDGQGPPKTVHVTRHGPGTTKRLNPRGPRAVWAENFCCFACWCHRASRHKNVTSFSGKEFSSN